MLVLKKISTKKLIIYIAVIIFMILGTMFMLYQNKKLTEYKINNPNTSATSSDVANILSGDSGNIEVSNNQKADEFNKAAKKLKQNSDFNLDIFSNDKFKNLQESTFIIKTQSEVGKRDPFNPN
ncbi:MAG: hypothetical protein WC349_02875 [Patescibacteria group bacterium]|jgi:hypothetical protein